MRLAPHFLRQRAERHLQAGTDCIAQSYRLDGPQADLALDRARMHLRIAAWFSDLLTPAPAPVRVPVRVRR